MNTLYLQNLFLVFIRVLSFLMVAPAFSSRSVPAQAKIGFAALLAFALLPGPEARLSALPQEVTPFLIVMGQEIVIGVLIGLVANLAFMALQMAGQIVGLQLGFGTAHLFDPLSASQASLVDQFYLILATLLFFTLNGHHALLLALQRTLDLVPPGQLIMSALIAERLIAVTANLFVAAVRIALPVMGSLMLADGVLALVARVIPQMSIFFVALPLKVGLGLLTIGLALPTMLAAFNRLAAGMGRDLLLILSRAG